MNLHIYEDVLYCYIILLYCCTVLFYCMSCRCDGVKNCLYGGDEKDCPGDKDNNNKWTTNDDDYYNKYEKKGKSCGVVPVWYQL